VWRQVSKFNRSKYSKSILLLFCRLLLRSTAYFGTFPPEALKTLNRPLTAKTLREILQERDQ